jgi:hypothetical protein
MMLQIRRTLVVAVVLGLILVVPALVDHAFGIWP